MYIFYNDGTMPRNANTADVIISGEDVNGYFGSSLALGDLDASGTQDLVVGHTNTMKMRAVLCFLQ